MPAPICPPPTTPRRPTGAPPPRLRRLTSSWALNRCRAARDSAERRRERNPARSAARPASNPSTTPAATTSRIVAAAVDRPRRDPASASRVDATSAASPSSTEGSSTRSVPTNEAASSTAASTSPSAGTTWAIRPAASSTATGLPEVSMSSARSSGTKRRSIWVPPPPGSRDRPTSGRPSWAPGTATMAWPARASSKAPPKAEPLMAVTIGVVPRAMRAISSWTPARKSSASSLAASSGSHPMSAPAPNDPSLPEASTNASTASSARTASI